MKEKVLNLLLMFKIWLALWLQRNLIIQNIINLLNQRIKNKYIEFANILPTFF